ncbi:MAG: LTA synthase family protein [Planctomycetota bacterium]
MPAAWILLWVLFFGFYRILLIASTWSFRGSAPVSLLTESLYHGIQFDISVTVRLLGIFVAWAIWRPNFVPWERKLFKILYAGVLFICAFTLACEIEFYKEFQLRLGPLAIEYFSTNSDHNKIVFGMIWGGYPVVRWILVTIVIVAVFYWLTIKLLKFRGHGGPVWLRIPATLLLIATIVIGARGGFRGGVLRWGDAFFSQNVYANHMAQNGVFAMFNTLSKINIGREESGEWSRLIKPAQAIETLRKATLLPGESLVDPEIYPLLRTSPPTTSIALKKRPRNVVLVMMESFTARFCGSIGADFGATPEFDKLANEGILFTRAFSAGTHTAQGVFTILCSFPNIPVYETIMKHPMGAQPFRSLPSILNDAGYETLYLANGLFSWDNMEGFFRNQGMKKFIGRDEYINPTFMDPDWGVSDYDVYNRALVEFNTLSGGEKPFLGVILTLSNHAPFTLPAVEGLHEITSGGIQNKRLNGVSYADWALGQFMHSARKAPWFSDTLFIFVGDHGFGIPPVLTEVNLLHMHVPLLFFGPEIFGVVNERRDVTAGHLDIVPTILGLLGIDTIHQSFGRNLFELPAGDAGRAYVKACGDANVGWIEGNDITISALERPTKLYEFQLGFPPSATVNSSPGRTQLMSEMEQKLRSMVRVGISTIEQRRVWKK